MKEPMKIIINHGILVMLNNLKTMNNQIFDKARDESSETMKKLMWERMYKQWDYQVADQMYRKIHGKMFDQMWEKMENQVAANTQDQLREDCNE